MIAAQDTGAQRIIRFYENLHFTGEIPDGIRVMNPIEENPEVRRIIRFFYHKFFNDQKPRRLILGINPGRFGAGSTGIPFTDTKRLNTYCGIPFHAFQTHEPSSVFIYEMIDTYGGVELFYSQFLISAICPLGFTITRENGRTVNFNYYDNPALLQSAYPFILDTLKKQLNLGIDPAVCYCLGTGKNEAFLRKLNESNRLFGRIVALEHPRFIMQYRAKRKEEYIQKYVEALKTINN